MMINVILCSVLWLTFCVAKDTGKQRPVIIDHIHCCHVNQMHQSRPNQHRSMPKQVYYMNDYETDIVTPIRYTDTQISDMLYSLMSIPHYRSMIINMVYMNYPRL